jgi:HD-like signal output (HDOD) protein
MSDMQAGVNPQPSLGELARPVNIPPRPSLLMAVQHEIGKKDPHIKKIANLFNRDVAIAGNLLSMANSAMFNLRTHVKTVEEAIALIGLTHCGALATSMMTKRALATGRMMMPRFWDVSEKRAWAMMYVCRQLKIAPPELAHNFGLFTDIGIPLMMASFPTYLETLLIANQMESDGFIQVENARHRINHAIVGAMLAEHWQIDERVVLAIKNHHTHEAMMDETIPAVTRGLIAAHFVVDKAIQEHRNAVSGEWRAGGHIAADALNLSAEEIETMCDELKQQFAQPNRR